MLNKEIDSIISSKVKIISDNINNKIYESAMNNPEYFTDGIKIPANQMFTIYFEQIDYIGEYGEDTYYERTGYEVDFSKSRDWIDIGGPLLEHYKLNGYILKLVLVEENIDYITQVSNGFDLYGDEILEYTTASKLVRINYFIIEQLEGRNSQHPLFKILGLVADQIQNRLKGFIENIDQRIILEISEDIQKKDGIFIYPAEEIFNFDSYSIKISDYFGRRYDYEGDINKTPFWNIYGKGLKEYYYTQGFELTVEYKDNEEANTAYSYHPLFEGGSSFKNYVQIKKIENRVKENKLLFLDTEVHDLKGPILIQLAYKDSDTGEITSKYYSTGGVQISDGAMGVHHITENMLEGKEVFSESKDKETLQKILNDKILVAHNAKFDIGVIQSVGMQVPKSICTLKIAHYLYPNLENYKLQTLRYTFKLELEGDVNPHDATSDILVLEKLFGKFYDALSSKLGTTDTEKIIEEMIDISSRPILLDTITFGKHKGGKWSTVPKDYLDWILNKSDFKNDEDIAYTCKYYTSENNKPDLSENMFAQAWRHNPGATKGIEGKKDDDYNTDRNNESKSTINAFGVFLILVVIMILLSVLI